MMELSSEKEINHIFEDQFDLESSNSYRAYSIVESAELLSTIFCVYIIIGNLRFLFFD